MKLTSKTSATLPKTPFLAVIALSGKKPELPKGVVLPPVALKDFKGEFRQQRSCDPKAGPADRVLLVGLGKSDKCDAEKLRRAAAIAVQAAEKRGCPAATLAISATLSEACGGARAAACAVAEGAVMGAYKYRDAKSKPEPAKLKSVSVMGQGSGFAAGLRTGSALGEANCFTRDLQNAPGNKMTPRHMASAAKKLAERSPRIRCSLLDEKKMAELKMGLLLGVSRGSSEPARLIHLVYKPKVRSKGKLALVGKGLSFDAGGISLKSGAKMDEMRYDMSGGAAVLGVFHALASIDVPFEVHGIVASSENLPDGAATKPGDVHRAMDGTTVEVLNTDAEGRLILGDALAYTCKKVKPDTIIDLATLTGAVVVGLGHELSGMFASSDRLRDDLSAAGRDTGEAVWPLPLLDIHKEKMKGAVADLRNIGPGDLGAGSSQGAAFLSHFVGDTEWCHLDIAGTAWGSAGRDYVGGSQGSGVGTRLLVRYLELRK